MGRVILFDHAIRATADACTVSRTVISTDIDPEDVPLTIDHPFGRIETTLAEWMRTGARPAPEGAPDRGVHAVDRSAPAAHSGPAVVPERRGVPPAHRRGRARAALALASLTRAHERATPEPGAVEALSAAIEPSGMCSQDGRLRASYMTS
jgi:hypothetical protein